MKLLALDDDQARVMRAAIALLRTTAADAASDFGAGRVRAEALLAVEEQLDGAPNIDLSALCFGVCDGGGLIATRDEGRVADAIYRSPALAVARAVAYKAAMDAGGDEATVQVLVWPWSPGMYTVEAARRLDLDGERS